ncbi:hypothetical protein [Occallatibacter savannae]|uniref:hypothetical protein n=1 Tax=Occallatibacter savannae TaxID=1002691 RepID=UPI000D6973A2|nr:hypothetical protein [Occallatibacter savannae]
MMVFQHSPGGDADDGVVGWPCVKAWSVPDIVPTGLCFLCAAHPTLKRGANELRAYGTCGWVATSFVGYASCVLRGSVSWVPH